jgi:hypothetical protein
MVKIGNKYKFYFGKDIYITYIVWDIDKSLNDEKDWIITLLTNDNYAGCEKEIKIKDARLFNNKRKIYDWSSNNLIL